MQVSFVKLLFYLTFGLHSKLYSILLIHRANITNLGLDVVRTDRTLVFYENEANQAKLWDILAVYAWMDKDIGYVQGNYLGCTEV